MKKLQCTKCNNWFTTKGKNYEKHTTSCKGDYKPPGPLRQTCVHCNRSFVNLTSSEKANHTRWCKLNPKASEYRESLAKRRADLQTPELIEKVKQGIKKAWKRGCYDHVNHQTFLGKTHTEEAKRIMREKALASKHRRLKKGTVMYKGVLLDSSWELVLAQRLDELNIEWIRPEPIRWHDKEGVSHHYFPDFYLPDFELYLDPKNPAAVKVQKEKIEILKQQLPNLIIIDNIDKCKNYTPVSQPPSKRSLTE